MKMTSKYIVSFCLIVAMLTLVACSNKSSVDYSQYSKVPLTASWSYNYESVRELADTCDLAAYVTIIEQETDERYNSYGIDLTIYTAEIRESLFGQSDGKIHIVMTGKIDEKEKKIYEIIDDPLMKPGDEFFVFAKNNEDGTYTILSGPQGRFEIIDNMVYSLNICNEQVAENNSGSNIVVDKQPKEDFYDQVKEIVSKR